MATATAGRDPKPTTAISALERKALDWHRSAHSWHNIRAQTTAYGPVAKAHISADMRRYGIVSLAWNTKRLLDASRDALSEERTPVEYHLLTARELYDATIISADRYSSGSAEWVLRGNQDSYSVTVVSRPFYALPQELCLSFHCFSKTTVRGNMTASSPPIDEVAFEFAALLSLLAREPIALLGLRRVGNKPITERYLYAFPPSKIRQPAPPSCPIDGAEFMAILKGLGSADQGTIDAALAATKLYYGGLSGARFDPSGAYVSLVSAIECLAGHHYKGQKFAFDDVPKFGFLKQNLDELAALPNGQPLVEEIKQKLIRGEYFLLHKFCLLVEEFLPQEFWTIPDDLYKLPATSAPDDKSALAKHLKAAYDARSTYVHAGTPFPAHIGFGLHDTVPIDVAMATMEAQLAEGKKVDVPAFMWFERMTHFVIREYLRRSFAPEVVKARDLRATEKVRLQKVIQDLPDNVRESLSKLTTWTMRFLGMSIINPHAPNGEWADQAATVTALRDAGLIGTTAGASWLKNREVGETVGEFFFGQTANPFRGNELLLPKDWKDVVAARDTPEDQAPPE